MIICVDIGNSNVVIGVWDGEWKDIWRVPTHVQDTQAFKLDILSRWIDSGYHASDISQVVISSVVPSLTAPYRLFFKDLNSGAVVDVISEKVYHFLDLEIGRPSEIGTDLVANAYGALAAYQRHSLIVDFGTALTFLAVSGDRRIVGASIAPGLNTALRTLRDETAQLPEVPLGIPDQVAGRHTVEAIQSGVVLGYEGLVLHLIRNYQEWHGEPFLTVATGGLINALPAFHKHFDIVNPTLTLDGMLAIGMVLEQHRSSAI